MSCALTSAPSPKVKTRCAPANARGVCRDGRRAALADRRLAVGHEEHEREPACDLTRCMVRVLVVVALARQLLRQRRVERAVDVRAAVRLQLIEVARRRRDVVRCGVDEVIAEGANVAREVDHAKAIVARERAKQLLSGGARLLHLAPAHRARHVEHEGNVARHRRRGAGGRGEPDEREAILGARRVRQHGDRGAVTARRGDENRHRRALAAGVDDARAAEARARLQILRGRVRVAPPGLGIAQRERRLTRVVRARGCERAPAAALVVDANRIALTRRDHLEAQHHALLFAGIDREDPRAKEPVAHPLDQCGITLATHDLFVRRSRASGVHDLAAHELSVDRELQLLKRRARGERIHVVRLLHRRAAIAERFLHFVAQHVIGERRAHVARGALERDGLRHALVEAHGRRDRRSRDDPSLRQEGGRKGEVEQEQRRGAHG